MPTINPNRSCSGSRNGVALLAVLACILLLTILVVSFISFTKLNRVSTAEYSNTVQAQEIAQGGLQDILGDLHAEIVAGSLSGATYAPTGQAAIYVPATNTTIVPARIGYSAASWSTNFTSTSLSPTLVRVSRATGNPKAVNGDTFFTQIAGNTGPYTNNIAAVPGGTILNRASQVSTALSSVNGRAISAARWNKTFLLSTNSVSVPSAFTNAPPDWVYVTETGSRVCSPGELATSPGLLPSANLTQNYGTITPGSNPPVSPVVGRYAYVVYDEGALLDANVAGSPSTLVSAGVAVSSGTAPPLSPAYTDPNTGRSLTFPGKSYESFVDLYQLPGLNTSAGQTQITALVNYRNAGGIAAANSSNGNTYLGAVFNYIPTAFTGFTSSGTATPDAPFVSRQDLINYFAKIDTGFNTASPTYSQALPYLGTFSRAVSAPSYEPPLNSASIPNFMAGMGSPVNYNSSAETAGIANRDLANVRFANNGPISVVHYYDDQTGTLTPTGTGTYTVNQGDPLLQNRFSLAKLGWLTQPWTGEPDPGTTAGSYATSNYPAAIQSCFGLVWGSPGSTTTNGNTSSTTANGGNPCWNYVGSPAGAGATAASFNGTIETLDLVAKENREPNFFELLKAAILKGSLGLSPGPAQFQNGNNTAVPSGFISPFDAKFDPTTAADLPGAGSMFSSTFGPSGTASQWGFSDVQIMQIGANIIAQYSSDNYPPAIYFPYGAGAYDPVTGTSANALFGPVSMVYGEKNLPLLSKVEAVLASPNPITTSGSYDPSAGPTSGNDDNTHSLEGWLQPELWNPHQAPATAFANSPTNFEIRAYGVAQTYCNEGANPAPAPALMADCTLAPNGWTPPGAAGLTAPSTSNWILSASQPQFWWTGTTSTESPTGTAEMAGTITFTDTTLASSYTGTFTGFYNVPRLLVLPGDTWAIQGVTNVTSPFQISSSTPGTVAGDCPPSVGAPGNIPYWNVQTLTNNVNYTNHFVGFTTGLISETAGTAPNQPFYVGSSYVADGGIGFQVGTAGVPAASFALGWVDSKTGFHPYSFVTGAFVQAHLTLYNDTGHPPDGRIGSANPGNSEQGPLNYGNVDPRTGRFLGSNNFVCGGGSAQDDTLFPNNDLIYAGECKTVGGIPKSGNFFTPYPNNSGTYPYMSFPEDWMMNATSVLTNPVQWTTNDPRRKTTSTGPAYYADPDGVVRPGDGLYCSVTYGDGLMLFTSYGNPSGATTALGDKPLPTTTSADTLPVSTAASSGNERHVRRPVILNRPFRSIGELGYVFRDLPFKTLDFFSPSSADAALLDVFSLTDESKVSANVINSVVAGQVNLSNATFPVVQAILTGASKKGLDPTYNFSPTLDGAKISTAIVNFLQIPASPYPSPNPLINRAALVTQVQGVLQSISAGAIVSLKSTFYKSDQYNKTYVEAPVRALTDLTSTRTWNLMIDIIAQSGQMAPTAKSTDTNALSEFVVQGEKRYWLHIAIDRYTGMIVAQQLEPVYE